MSTREPDKTALVCGVSGRSYTYRCSEMIHLQTISEQGGSQMQHQCDQLVFGSGASSSSPCLRSSWSLIGRQARRCGSSSIGKLPRVYNTLQVTENRYHLIPFKTLIVALLVLDWLSPQSTTPSLGKRLPNRSQFLKMFSIRFFLSRLRLQVANGL